MTITSPFISLIARSPEVCRHRISAFAAAVEVPDIGDRPVGRHGSRAVIGGDRHATHGDDSIAGPGPASTIDRPTDELEPDTHDAQGPELHDGNDFPRKGQPCAGPARPQVSFDATRW